MCSAADKLTGDDRNQQQPPQQQYGQPQYGQSQQYGQPQHAGTPQHGADADKVALAKYDYLLRTSSPEQLEQVHHDAFARLTPAQRQQVRDRLNSELPPHEHLRDDSAGGMARAMTRGEMSRPGLVRRVLGGSGRSGNGNGNGRGRGGAFAGGAAVGAGAMAFGGLAAAVAGGAVLSAAAGPVLAGAADLGVDFEGIASGMGDLGLGDLAVASRDSSARASSSSAGSVSRPRGSVSRRPGSASRRRTSATTSSVGSSTADALRCERIGNSGTASGACNVSSCVVRRTRDSDGPPSRCQDGRRPAGEPFRRRSDRHRDRDPLPRGAAPS